MFKKTDSYYREKVPPPVDPHHGQDFHSDTGSDTLSDRYSVPHHEICNDPALSDSKAESYSFPSSRMASRKKADSPYESNREKTDFAKEILSEVA
jgi:hypothetical protein